jgi:hypothetical protein
LCSKSVKDKDAAYLDRHLIPPDPALWKLDRFEEFIVERRKLIEAKFAYLLSAPPPSVPAP